MAGSFSRLPQLLHTADFFTLRLLFWCLLCLHCLEAVLAEQRLEVMVGVCPLTSMATLYTQHHGGSIIPMPHSGHAPEAAAEAKLPPQTDREGRGREAKREAKAL